MYSLENANVSPEASYDYGPYRCTCLPRIPCATCKAQPRSSAQTTSDARRRSPYAEDAGALLSTRTRHHNRAMPLAERRARIRDAVAQWLTDHTALPPTTLLRPPDSPPGLSVTTIYRAYESINDLWQDCAAHEVCTPAQLHAALKLGAVANRRNGSARHHASAREGTT